MIGNSKPREVHWMNTAEMYRFGHGEIMGKVGGGELNSKDERKI